MLLPQKTWGRGGAGAGMVGVSCLSNACCFGSRDFICWGISVESDLVSLFPLGFSRTGAAHLLTSHWLWGDTFSLRKLFKYCDFHGFSICFFLLFSFLSIHWSHGPDGPHDILLSLLHLYSISMEYGNYLIHLSIHWTINRSQGKPKTNSIFHWKMPREWLAREVFTGEKWTVWWDFRVCAREDQPMGGLLPKAETVYLFCTQAGFGVPICTFTPDFPTNVYFWSILLKAKCLAGLGHFVSEVGGVRYTRN